jgi:hypothetical protein
MQAVEEEAGAAAALTPNPADLPEEDWRPSYVGNPNPRAWPVGLVSAAKANMEGELVLLLVGAVGFFFKLWALALERLEAVARTCR